MGKAQRLLLLAPNLDEPTGLLMQSKQRNMLTTHYGCSGMLNGKRIVLLCGVSLPAVMIICQRGETAVNII
jgi:hypothetical protein